MNELFQAVLIAQESITNRGKRTENKMWKRVVLSETEFAWLPPNISRGPCAVMPCVGDRIADINGDVD